MAIKIECGQCGFRNDLGRVFCTKCGLKLDLQRTSHADLQERREIEYGAIFGRIAGFLFVLAPILLVGLALWPPNPLVVMTDGAGAQQVPMKTRAVKQALMARQKVAVEFTEAELNGFLAVRAQTRGLKKLAMDVNPGQFDLAASFAWRPAAATNFAWVVKNKIALPVTLTLSAGFAQGKLEVQGAKIGHLPLPGLTRSVVAGFFGGVFQDIVSEKQVVESLADGVVGPDRISLRFGR